MRACGPQDRLIVEDGEGEPAVGDEHCLECVDLPGEGASCDWLLPCPTSKALSPLDGQPSKDHDGFAYLYSLVLIYPTVKGQDQNTWSRHCPQPQGAQTPAEAGVQTHSGLALTQSNPQSLFGKNQNKEKSGF